jgi:hypothetical protein
LNQPFESGERLGVADTSGAVLSILIVTESLEDPPALWAEHEDVAPAVSTVKFWVPQPESMTAAESGSVTVHATVTLLVYQPLLPAVPVMVFVMTGAVVSQIRVTDAVAALEEFPAESVETALIVFEPHTSGTARRVKFGAVKVAAEPLTVTPATPLVASFAVPLTSIVGFVVDAGSALSVTDGMVVSRLIVWVFDDVPPVLVAVHVMLVVPSVFTVVVVESVAHDADRDVTADSLSVTVKLTVMLPVLYQPFEPFGLAGLTTGAITGGVVSVAAV